MGNSSVSILEPLNTQLKAINKNFRVRAIALIGKSDGEDQIIGPLSFKNNCEAWKGSIVRGVFGDGDIELGFPISSTCKLPVNWDTKTYNPEGINFQNESSFLKAGQNYLAQILNNTEFEARPIVDNSGKRTGKMTSDLGPDGKPLYSLGADKALLASWSPADFNLAQALLKANPSQLKKLSTLVNTGEGDVKAMMPATLVSLNVFGDIPGNADKLVRFIHATDKAAKQIDAHPEALDAAMKVADKVYGKWKDGNGEEIPDSWKERVKAYRGYKVGQLQIGGSTVLTIKDQMAMLNMNSDGTEDLDNSTFSSVYRLFGDIAIKNYDMGGLKAYTPFNQFFYSGYLRAAYEMAKKEGTADVAVKTEETYLEGSGTLQGENTYQITFALNSAAISPQSLPILRQIQDKYAVSGYRLEIEGHSDRKGNAASNLDLSGRRADSIKNHLEKVNKFAFGNNRVTAKGFGSEVVPENAPAEYKAGSSDDCPICRRVVIKVYKIQ
jgi:outer membrane protein OmpA-like peptidoglycan-associated protein